MSRERLRSFVRPLVVGLMIGCVALGVGEMLHVLIPRWGAFFFAGICVLTAIEAQYSYRLVQARSEFHTEIWKSRAVELGLLFVLIRIGTFVGVPWPDIVAEISAWPNDLERILDAKTVTASLLAFIAWLASTQLARALQRLDEPTELHPGERPTAESVSRWFHWGGGVLLVASGVARVGIATLLQLDRPPVSGLVLNVLVYFGLGLFLLGQVRFVSLRKAWQEQKTEIGAGFAARWVRYSLVLLLIAGVLAFVLPTRYTLGLLDAIGGVVQIAIAVINVIYMLLIFLLSLPVWLVSRLFREAPDAPAPPLPDGPLLRQPLPERQGISFQLSDSARALFFWLLALGIVVYVVWNYLLDHPDLWRALIAFAPIRALRALWRALCGRVRRWTRRIGGPSDSQESGESVLRRAGPYRRSWFGVRSPREQVLYHYLGVLRRARRRGLPRRAPETPREYGQELRPSLPQAEAEVDLLTAAFVEARYSEHPVESARGAEAREWGQQIRSALRRQPLRRSARRRSAR